MGWNAATDAMLMICPPLAMYGMLSWHSATTAWQFRSVMFRLTCKGVSATAANFPNPLAFTSSPISTGSSASAASYTPKLVRSVRSSASTRAGKGMVSRSASSRSPCRAMSHISSHVPNSVTRWANRLPIPLDAPVMTAIFFMSSTSRMITFQVQYTTLFLFLPYPTIHRAKIV